MRLIEQLVRYLETSGTLTASNLFHLARHGFVELPEDVMAGREADQARSQHEGGSVACTAGRRSNSRTAVRTIDDYEERLLGKESRDRRKGRRRSHGQRKQPDGQALSAWLVGQFESWEDDLSAMTTLARRFAPCTSWIRAAVLLEQSPRESVADCLAKSLQSGPLGFDDFWKTLSFSAYRQNLPTLDRPTANAYQVILLGDDIGNVAKHAWILKHKPVAAV